MAYLWQVGYCVLLFQTMRTFQINLFGEKTNEEKLRAEIKKKENAKSKQQLFVLHYLKNGCKNATISAKEAGYSAKSAKNQASRLLKNKQVQILIEEQKKRLKNTLEIDADYLAKEAHSALLVAKGEKSANRFIKDKDGGFIKNQQYYDGGELLKTIEVLAKLTGSFSETKKVEHSFNIEDLKNESLDDILSKNI